MPETPAPAPGTSTTEAKLLFRADTDQNGDWYVWRKLSKYGWATLRRCDCREAAFELAETMNKDPDAALFRG